MRSRRRLLCVVILVVVAVSLIYSSYEIVGRFLRLFLPHAGYPLNQDQALARYRVEKHQPEHVPRIIHQVFHNWQHPGNESALLPQWEAQRQTCIDKNPEWEYKVCVAEGADSSRMNADGFCF